MIRADRRALARSDFLAACASHPSGGSREVLEAALQRQKRGLMRAANPAGGYPV